MPLILSALATAAAVLAPSSPALPNADPATVTEAAGQLFWASPPARGAVTLHTQKYALDDFQQAVTDLDNGAVRGRAILVP